MASESTKKPIKQKLKEVAAEAAVVSVIISCDVVVAVGLHVGSSNPMIHPQYTNAFLLLCLIWTCGDQLYEKWEAVLVVARVEAALNLCMWTLRNRSQPDYQMNKIAQFLGAPP